MKDDFLSSIHRISNLLCSMQKAIDIFLFLLFGVFAALQYNDPDAFLWVVIYGVVALVSLLRVFGVFQRGMVFLLLIAIGLFGLLHAPYFYQWITADHARDIASAMDDDKQYLEGTREFFGLLLAAICLAYHLYLRPKS
jgi:hypothetical protein